MGAIIVKDRMIISDGYNGTPSGFDNCCEDKNNETNYSNDFINSKILFYATNDNGITIFRRFAQNLLK